MPKIKVLSIGINKYLNPSVNELNKCIQDVKSIQSLLKKKLNIPEPNFLMLTNESATRRGIIDAFRTHFQGLVAGDIAFLHYSGHGSWEDIAPAFVEVGIDAPDSRTEVLVCYDSKINNTYNIADKELRWLVHELQYTKEGEETGVAFVALMDCCHSSSMLRKVEDGIKRRMHPGNKEARPLSAFLERKYADMKKLHLPKVNYISLSACSPRQSAIEDINGGVFTNAVVKVLNRAFEANRIPSYAELFSSVNEITKVNAGNYQNPHFEYTGHVNPYQTFLSAGEVKPPQFPIMTVQGQKGRIGIGAIHGVNSNSVQRMEIPIYREGDFQQKVGTAVEAKVGLEYTEVMIKEPHSEEYEGNALSQLEKTYYAGLKGSALPIHVNITADAEEFKDTVYEALLSPQNAFNYLDEENANYRLSVTPQQLSLLKRSGRDWQLIHGVKQTDSKALDYIVKQQLAQIARWEQVNDITNAQKSTIEIDKLDFSFSYYDYEDELHTILFHEGHDDKATMQIELAYEEDKGGIPYLIELKNRNRADLYFYLVHLDAQFMITQRYENYLQPLSPNASIILYDSEPNNEGLGLSEGEKEVIDTFILIASKEVLDIPYVFEQGGFEMAYGIMIASPEEWELKYKKAKKGQVRLKDRNRVNWAVKRIEIKLKRK